MEYILSAENLSKSYGKFCALSGLSLHLPKGAIYGLVGKNGAGKTTFIRIICGLQAPSSGEYTLYGKKNSEKAVSKMLKDLGITDVDKAKKILADAAAAEDASQSVGQDDTRVAELNASLEASVLENIMLTEHVNPEKVARAVKLIDRADCLDDEGKFSRDKATEAVKKLFSEWPELAVKADERQVGFAIGGDGKQNTAPAGADKPVTQKSWNRFNH